MRSKLARHLAAHCAVVALLFGQFALAAYVRPAQPPNGPVAVHTEAGHVPCAEMASVANPPEANACEVRCSDGVTPPAQPDLPPVALVALPVPAVALAKLPLSAEAARTPCAALPGAPPLNLQFCRLLI